MNDEEPPNIGDELHTAMLRNLADVNYANNFARNIANLIHMAYLKVPGGTELEADLASMEQYAGYVCSYFQSMENSLREALIQAGASEQSGTENDTNHSIH